MPRNTLLKAAVLCTMLFLSHVSFSQNKVVSGKVTDLKDGSGIPGVSFTPKAGITGTQTGSHGSYKITVANSVTTLIFSSVGFKSQEVSI